MQLVRSNRVLKKTCTLLILYTIPISHLSFGDNEHICHPLPLTISISIFIYIN